MFNASHQCFSHLKAMSKVLRLVVVLACFVAFLKGMEESVKKYLEEPISTNTINRKMGNYEFPSVTFCSYNITNYSPVAVHENYTYESLMDDKIFSLRNMVQWRVACHFYIYRVQLQNKPLFLQGYQHHRD